MVDVNTYTVRRLRMLAAGTQAQAERRLVEHEGAEREDRQDQPGRPVGLVEEQLAEERDISFQIAGDAEIHRRIYRMARNDYLAIMLTQNFNLALRLWYFCNQSAPSPTPETVDHRPLALAILTADSEKARTLMREHVAHDSDRVRDLLFKSTA